jgi:hypothetical protein
VETYRVMHRPLTPRIAIVLVLAFGIAGTQFAETTDARQATRADSAYITRAARAESVFFAFWRAAWMARMDSSIERLDSAGRRMESAVSRATSGARTSTGRASSDSAGSAAATAPAVGAVIPSVFPVGRPFAGFARHVFAGAHCHWDGTFGLYSIIRSARAAQAMCPSWLLPSDSMHSRVTEPFVRWALRDSVAFARRYAIAMLDSAAVHAPADAWVVGQRVRLALDGGEGARALHIATRECRTNAWWCSALAGYVLAQSGDIAGADSAFARATGVTTGAARCQWNDVRGVLLPRDRREYVGESCAKRDSLADVFMWLSDPLWSDAVNERRVEHFARQVMVLLRSAIRHDEYYVWPAAFGGDATAEMLLRYGRPSVIQWLGFQVDTVHGTWLAATNSTHRPPYTTAEYTRDRVHLAPEWSAVESPLTAAVSDWSLTSDDQWWWPAEHMRLPYALASIDTMQVAMFRRDTTALFTFSASLPRTPGSDDSLSVTTMRSVAPNATHRLRENRVITGQRHVVSAAIQPGESLVSLEFANNARDAFTRARFSVEAPPELVTMGARDRAVSDITFIEAPASQSDTLPNTPDAALRLMLASTVVSSRVGRVGLYWETYGFAASDSVEVSLRVQRFTGQSMLRRVGIALGSANDLNAPIAITWNEPDPTRRAATLGGRVPTLGRSLVLAFGALTPGDYWLDITVRSRRGESASTRRVFTVR